MLHPTQGDDGVRMLDVETYLNTFSKIKISKDLTLRVGKFTVEDIAKTKAIGQAFIERQEQATKNNTPLDESEVFGNLIDQLMVVLEKDNPGLERASLEQMPPAAINSIFKFVLAEGMGLEKGLGNAEAVVKPQTITA